MTPIRIVLASVLAMLAATASARSAPPAKMVTPALGSVIIDTRGASGDEAVDLEVIGWNRPDVTVTERWESGVGVVVPRLSHEGSTTRLTAMYTVTPRPWFLRLLHWGSGVRVRWTVHVPAHEHLTTFTTNADVAVAGVRAPLSVEVGNGDIAIVAAGPVVSAQTGNGDVHVAVTSLAGSDPQIRLSTRNGDVALKVPQGFATRVTTTTVNGDTKNPFAHAHAAGVVALSTTNGDATVSQEP